MKKYLNKLLVTAGLGMLLLASCQKQETKIYYEGGTAPVLTASLSDSIPLITADSFNVAVSFSWTNPNYNFSNGVNSQNVTYNLEIDTLGANFTNPAMQTLSNTSVLGTSITVKQLNTILAGAKDLNLAASQSHTIQVRLVAQLGVNQAQVISNVLNFMVTPYPPPPAVAPPTEGTLFIVGSATSGGSATGWDNPIDVGNVAGQQFTKVSTTEYKITIPLIGGGEYKFIGKDGSWGDQWSVATTDDPTELYGGPFIYNGNNTLAPPTSGTYDIDVNFQTGIFTVKLH